MAEPRRDYYEVLGVGRGADAGAIKDAFRKLALQGDIAGVIKSSW